MGGQAQIRPRPEWPLPPADLMLRATGSEDPDRFDVSGHLHLEELDRALSAHGRGLAQFGGILDFGCGPGRLLRHLIALAPHAHLHGVDRDEEALGWIRGALPVETTVARGRPPLALAESRFDLILAYDVFAHLEEDAQGAWLAELRRLSLPNVVMAVTRVANDAVPRRSERFFELIDIAAPQEPSAEAIVLLRARAGPPWPRRRRRAFASTSRGAPELEATTWYHAMRVGGTITPGVFDMQRALAHVPLPDSLAGSRCLDVGTADGFWAFEMERRGAAEVVAIDLPGGEERDWPVLTRGRPRPAHMVVVEGRARQPMPGFTTAHRLLGSRVEWRAISTYDLSPEAVGKFDFVFVGSILLHLRDPVAALEAVRSVTREEALINECVSLPLSVLRPGWPAARLIGLAATNWWVPNVAALRRLAETAGFEVLAAGRPYFVRWGPGANRFFTPTRAPFDPRPTLLARYVRDSFGIPHAYVRVRPVR